MHTGMCFLLMRTTSIQTGKDRRYALNNARDFIYAVASIHIIDYHFYSAHFPIDKIRWKRLQYERKPFV